MLVNAINQVNSKRCHNCGHDYPHAIGTTCPAIGKQCHRCGKNNHLAAVCMRKESNRPSIEASRRFNSPANHSCKKRYSNNISTPRQNDRNEFRERHVHSRQRNSSIRQVDESSLFNKIVSTKATNAL